MQRRAFLGALGVLASSVKTAKAIGLTIPPALM